MANSWSISVVSENLEYLSIFSVITAVLCTICGYTYLRWYQNKTIQLVSQPQPVTLPSNEYINSNTADNRINDSLIDDIIGKEEAEVRNIQSRMKKARQRTMVEEVEKDMTVDDKQREAEVRRQQLEAIFKLMKQSPEEFGISSIDEMEEQVKLYNM